jgi:WD40 repeat protein
MSQFTQVAIALVYGLIGIGGQPQHLPQEVTLSTPCHVEAAMIAPSGKVAAGSCNDHKVRVWALPDGRLLQTLDLDGRDNAVAAISDDGHWLLFGDYHGDVTVWDSSTGRPRFEQRFDRYLLAAAFSHDGRLLAIAPGGRTLRIIDLFSTRVVSELEHMPAATGAVAFSRDNALIATADGDAVRVYDVRTGKLISQNSDFLSEPLTVDFTPDGKQAIAAGGDKVVVLIDSATGKTLRRMNKTAALVFYIEVSPDGSQFAAITLNSDDMGLASPIIIFDIASLQKKIEWTPPTGVLGGGTWPPDGHYIIATSTPQALHLWRLR